MGLEIDRSDFSDAEYELFAQRLRLDLAALEALLQRKGFGEGAASLGAELEMFLVGEGGRALGRNREVLARADDNRVTLELSRFNMECNASPAPLVGKPFTALAGELDSLLSTIRSAAHSQGAQVAVIGILPTLREEDLHRDALTKKERYRALSAGIRAARDEKPFQVRIDGREPLELDWDDVTLQGANTSFQVHLRVTPQRFVSTYNAAQLATAPVLAAAGNSPFFLGHELWEETRIALFKQSVDDRSQAPSLSPRVSRASFGHGWTHRSALELFEQSVALHAPLLPVTGEEDALSLVRAGKVPELGELRLHHGTIWTLNRAVYDSSAGGHLRIEYRALPAGPSMRDMMANAALLLGLTLGLEAQMHNCLAAMPFSAAEANFYQAAKWGLDAQLGWPSAQAPSPRAVDAPRLLHSLLPTAEAGLKSAGVDSAEVSDLLGLISDRLDAKATGARWQRETVADLQRGMSRADALQRMLQLYQELARGGAPVHVWSR